MKIMLNYHTLALALAGLRIKFMLLLHLTQRERKVQGCNLPIKVVSNICVVSEL